MGAAEVRSFLERHGLAPRRDLGQNFLWDEQLAARLVELAGVQPGDRVLEIGAGLGALTRALAARAERVLTLEVDAGIVRALRAEGTLPARVELRHADALRTDLPALVAELGAPVRVVANLPYAISGPLLRRLLDLRGVLVDWSVMLQREVAGRLAAGKGSRAYGSLAVLHALCVQVESALDLSPHAFHPTPQVRSRFLRLRPLPGGGVGDGELAAVERVARAAFNQRRKTLANALAGLCPRETVAAWLAGRGLDPRLRAEGLEPGAFLDLAREMVI